MSTFLATSNPLIRDLAITRYELSFVSESLYTSASVTLYFSEILTPDILVTLRK